MNNKSNNVAQRPEIVSHIHAISNSIIFLSRKYKYLNFSKSEFIEYYLNILNEDFQKHKNIYDSFLEHIVKYLENISEKEYYKIRTIISKSTGHRIDLLRHESIINAIENAHRRNSSFDGEVRKNCKIIRKIKNEKFSTLNTDIEEFWLINPPNLTFEESILKFKKSFDVESLGYALINYESNKHINLVWHQANKLEKLFPNRTSSELLSMGWIGLRTALRLYNPNLGFSFSTYACTRISGTIRDYIRAENLIPKRLTTFNRKVIAVEEALTLSLGRSPRVDEIAASLGVTTSDLSILPRLQNPASLDELITDDEGNERSQIYISSGNDPVDNLLISERNKVIMDSLTKLDPIDAKIITLIIFEGKKPSEIELIIGENSRKIRLRKERAFNQIKNDLLSWN